MSSPDLERDADSLLLGAVDLHVHFGPDAHLQRSVDALEAAEQAAAAGMAAIVLKSHDYPTAALATIVDKAVGGVRVFGGLCLDRQVGGLNPSAVEVAVRLDTKIIWLPTLSSANDHAKLGFPGPGISILDARGALRVEMHEIFALVKGREVARERTRLRPGDRCFSRRGAPRGYREASHHPRPGNARGSDAHPRRSRPLRRRGSDDRVLLPHLRRRARH